MNSRLKLLSTAAILALGLAASSSTLASLQSNWNSSNSTEATTQTKKVKFTFVIESEHGQLVHLAAGNKYQLIIPSSDVKSILAISSRPYKVSTKISLEQFNKIIHTGPDSFDKNPPNIAITFKGKLSCAFEAIKISQKGSDTIYDLMLLDGQKAPGNMSGPVYLLVDDMISKYLNGI